jgi:hypothetical protein
MLDIILDLAPENTSSGTKYREVANRTAMLALSNATVGEIVKITGINQRYILRALPASTVTNWNKVYILKDAIQTITPASNAADINFLTNDIDKVLLDCLAQTAHVNVTLTPQQGFTQVIEVKFGATPINLVFSSDYTILQAGGGGSTIAGVANSRMLITVFVGTENYVVYLSPVIYA